MEPNNLIVRLADFDCQVWDLITSYLDYHTLERIVSIGCKRLNRHLIVNGGIRSLNVLGNVQDGFSARFPPILPRPQLSTHCNVSLPLKMPSWSAFQRLSTLIYVPGDFSSNSWTPVLRDLPHTLTRLDWESKHHFLTESDTLTGNLNDWCPNLTDLSINVENSNLIPPQMLIDFLPPQLASFRFNTSLQQETDAWQALARLPKGLTKFSLVVAFLAYARRIDMGLSTKHFSIPLPSTLTDLRLHPYRYVPLQSETEFGWKIPILRLDLDAVSPLGLQLLPNSLTHLSMRMADPLLATWPRDLLPNLQVLSTFVAPRLLQILPSSIRCFRNDHRFMDNLLPESPISAVLGHGMLTERLVRLEFADSIWPEVWLSQLPPSVTSLLVKAIALDGSSIPRGQTVVEHFGELKTWFLQNSRRSLSILFQEPDQPFELCTILSVPNEIEDWGILTKSIHWRKGFPIDLKILRNFSYFNLNFELPTTLTYLSFDPKALEAPKELHFRWFLEKFRRLRTIENAIFHVSEYGLNSLLQLPTVVDPVDGSLKTRLRIPEDLIEHHYRAFSAICFVNCRFNTRLVFIPPQTTLPYVVQEIELTGVYEIDANWETKSIFRNGLLRFAHFQGGFKAWFPLDYQNLSLRKEYILPSLPSSVTHVTLERFSAHCFLFDTPALVRQFIQPIARSLRILEIDGSEGFDDAEFQYKNQNQTLPFVLPTNLLSQVIRLQIRIPTACLQRFNAPNHPLVPSLPSQLNSVTISDDGCQLTAICTDPKLLVKSTDCVVM